MEPTALSTRDPERLGDWQLLSKLAEGGMGSVYLGESAGRLAAIKTVHPQVAHTASGSQRFQREYAAAQLVASPFVGAVIEADLTSPTPYLALEYIKGTTLQEVIATGGPMHGDELERFARDLARGLRSIHKAGVTHRDLKPSNVILTEDGPVIIDFGIALIDEESDLTATNHVVGSPGWMSPEHLGVGQVGPASDVFGWGGLVYFAGTGENPFGVGNHQALMYRIANGSPDPHDIAKPVGDLVTQALNRLPAQRPSLDAVLAGLDESESRSGSRSVRRPSALALVAVVVALAVAVGASTWLALRGETSTPAAGDADLAEGDAAGVTESGSTNADRSGSAVGGVAADPTAIQVDCDAGLVRKFSDIDMRRVELGAEIQLKRGCEFDETLVISASGQAGAPIVVSAYGDAESEPPVITTPEDTQVTGGLIELNGSHIEIRDLSIVVRPNEFHVGCEATPLGWTVGITLGPTSSNNRVENISVTGAHAGVYVDKGASGHAIVGNTFHANTMMNEVSGAFGVQIFGDANLVSGNSFSGHSACHPNYSLDAGAAINLYDGTDNLIVENTSRGDRAFLSVNGGDDQNPVGNVIERNVVVSDEPASSFVAMDASNVDGVANQILHNTVVLRGERSVGLWCGQCEPAGIAFANNIIWAATGRSKSDESAGYSGGANLFWSSDGEPSLAPMDVIGASDLVADPLFVDPDFGLFELLPCSPALGGPDVADIGALESAEPRCEP